MRSGQGGSRRIISGDTPFHAYVLGTGYIVRTSSIAVRSTRERPSIDRKAEAHRSETTTIHVEHGCERGHAGYCVRRRKGLERQTRQAKRSGYRYFFLLLLE